MTLDGVVCLRFECVQCRSPRPGFASQPCAPRSSASVPVVRRRGCPKRPRRNRWRPRPKDRSGRKLPSRIDRMRRTLTALPRLLEKPYRSGLSARIRSALCSPRLKRHLDRRAREDTEQSSIAPLRRSSNLSVRSVRPLAGSSYIRLRSPSKASDDRSATAQSPQGIRRHA